MSTKAVVRTTLRVRMISPTSKIYEGEAVSVTASNKVGEFDILAGHANFFSLLDASTVVINTGSQKLSCPISGGLLKVKNNEVTLFINIGDVAASE